MRRVRSFGIALLLAGLVGLPAKAGSYNAGGVSRGAVSVGGQSAASATCDAAQINPDSYRLTTEAQALNILRPREPWWEKYGVWKSPREIGSLNAGATKLAEEARRIDPRNLLAHSILARQYVVEAIDAQKAEEAWKTTIDGGGAVVWTATLYDVDPRSFFVVAMDPRGLRIYRFGQLGGELRTHFGVPEFPEPDRTDFWRALGGCLPANAAPEAQIPWSEVREIEVTDWTLRFRLAGKTAIESDRGNRRTLDTLNINLHGQIGAFDFRYGMSPYGRRPIYGRPGGVAATHYEQRVKQMLDKFFVVRGS
jgi:hypothetical protein